MKRIADLTNDECDIVFMRLQHELKRQALHSVYNHNNTIQVYNNSVDLRDVLKYHIVKWVDIKTFYRLKQCCKAFNTYLSQHPSFLTISNYYTLKQQKAIQHHVNDDMFYYGMLRLYWILEQMEPSESHEFYEYQHLLGEQYVIDERKRLKQKNIYHIRKDRASLLSFIRGAKKGKLVWCSVLYGHGLVHYPSGIIVKKDDKKARGHIFDLHPERAFSINEYGGICVKYTTNMTKDEKEQNKYLNSVIKNKINT